MTREWWFPGPQVRGTGGTRIHDWKREGRSGVMPSGLFVCLGCGPGWLFAGVGDVPDGAGGVVGDVEGAVGAGSDADGASPDFAIGEDEAGEEVLIVAGGVAGLVERDADDFIAGAGGAVPGAVFGGEDVALVLGGELGAVVKGHFQRGVVGLEEDVGVDEFGLQLGVGAGVAGILVAADVPPGPAVEAAGFDVGDVVGDEVVAECVALVDGAPEFAGDGVDGEADGVADA